MAPENRCSPYDRSDYPYPQSVDLEIIEELGSIYGSYTGACYSNKGETDIEHIVAVSEAHDSGLCAADDETRRAFARDLLNLTLASPRVNRNLYTPCVLACGIVVGIGALRGLRARGGNCGGRAAAAFESGCRPSTGGLGGVIG